MASANVVQLSDQTFEQEVLKSEQPVLVDFWAEWCQPCLMLAPAIDGLADEYHGKVKVAKVDVDACRETAMKFGISSIPTVMLFHKGQAVGNLRGLRPKKDFKEMIDKVVPAAV